MFTARRDEQIILHGRPVGAREGLPGSMEVIPAAEFASKMRLATNSHSDIARDKGRPSYFSIAADWTDVVVERKSFAKWVEKGLTRNRSRAGSNSIKRCVEWLVELRKAGPPGMKRSEYEACAKQKFSGLGPSQFGDAWKKAAEECPSSDWGRRGRPLTVRPKLK